MRQQQDYILRLIEQLGAMIRAALGRREVLKTEEHGGLAGQALGLVLSMDPEMASNLSPQSLVALLELTEVDARVLALLQEALDVEATALGDQGDLTTAMLRRDQAEAIRSLLEKGAADSSGGAPGDVDVSYTA